MVDISTRTGLDKDARCSFSTFDVIVAEKSMVLLPCVESGISARILLSSNREGEGLFRGKGCVC